MLSFFNAPAPNFKPLPTKSWLAETRGQLEDILANDEFQKADKIQVLEVRMAPLDAPESLVKQGKLVRPPLPSFPPLLHPSLCLRAPAADAQTRLQSAELNSA